MSTFQTGTIQSINLKDDNPNEVYSVRVLTSKGSGRSEVAYPIDVNIKRVPLIGESVILISSMGAEASGGSRRAKQYYISSTAVQLNVHNNALPKGAAPQRSTNTLSTYTQTLTGTPNVSKKSEVSLGKGFEERTDVGSLQPFIGDVLLEGRFGHSLRFGYSPKESDTTQSPSWESSNVSDPITILSNGREGGSYNKFSIEDVNKDLSSIWMGSSQRIKLEPSNKFTLGVTPQNSYNKPQLIFNSDRVVINSKSDSVLISGGKSVNISTKSWKADMDEIFNQLEVVVTELSKAASVMVGLGIPINVASLSKAVASLKLMKQ